MSREYFHQPDHKKSIVKYYEVSIPYLYVEVCTCAYMMGIYSIYFRIRMYVRIGYEYTLSTCMVHTYVRMYMHI